MLNLDCEFAVYDAADDSGGENAPLRDIDGGMVLANVVTKTRRRRCRSQSLRREPVSARRVELSLGSYRARAVEPHAF